MNPIAWITNPITARMRQKKLDELRQRYTPTGQMPTTDVVYDDRAMQAMTYANAAQARDRMHIDFKASITTVSAAIATVNNSLGFGQAQQDFAFYCLSQNKAFDHEQTRRATASRIADGNSVWGRYLLQELTSRVENDN
jgi:hypothetical protein